MATHGGCIVSVASLEEETKGLFQPRPRGRVVLGIQGQEAEDVRCVGGAEWYRLRSWLTPGSLRGDIWLAS